MPRPESTAAWTAAIAAGDEAAFAAFYDAWFDAAFALARAVSRRDESFCLDVVQDVMLKVVRRMRPLSTEPEVAAWMSRAIANAAVDRLRSEQRRRRREERAAPAVATGPDLGERLEHEERHAWLQLRLAELPAVERELVAARFSGDDSVTAASAALGLSADAAHGRLRRCLVRLRRAAKEWLDG